MWRWRVASKPTSIPEFLAHVRSYVTDWEKGWLDASLALPGIARELDAKMAETAAGGVAPESGDPLVERGRGRAGAAPLCRLCGGVGAIEGFWLGTVKTCPACHGRGQQ